MFGKASKNAAKEKEPKVKELKVKESKVKEPKIKEKKVKEAKKSNKPKSNIKIFGIRNKIYFCFIVPIIFMVIVGYVAYNKASEGLISKFNESSVQTLNMGVEYLDLVSSNIQAEATRYTMDNDFESYALGMPGHTNMEKATYFSNQRIVLVSSQAANPFINNIHMVTKSISRMISTGSQEKLDGIYDAYIEDLKERTGVDNNFPRWITTHPMIDEVFGLKPAETFITYQVQDGKKMAYIIIDVKREALKGVLDNIDYGEGSYVGMLTPDAKEIAKVSGTDALLDEVIFANEKFYQDAEASEELSGSKTVDYLGKEYLFIYNKSEVNGLMLCALIPEATIVGQAESIKSTTMMLVLVAAIIAVLIGSFIAAGIQKNMKHISKKLDEVAKGDLTVSVDAKGNDEFQTLAKAATNMVSNNKNLIMSLSNTADDLQVSATNVNDASNVITNYSNEITEAIDEISQGMNKQSEHALECVNITNVLSEKIQNINTDVTSIETAINEAQLLIQKGMNIVDNLSKRATQTEQMTSKVGETISKLEAEASSISAFVQTINSISEQTNLLSLNASIEAARAGDAGRGFAVVAEEIRNLADNSSAATVEIDNKIKNINSQTQASVDSATEAEKMVLLQQEAVNEVIGVFNKIYDQMQTLIVALNKISESAHEADKQRSDTVDAVDNISAIIEQTAANSSQVRDMAANLLSSVDRLGQTADSLDSNMNGLKKEIAEFNI